METFTRVLRVFTLLFLLLSLSCTEPSKKEVEKVNQDRSIEESEDEQIQNDSTDFWISMEPSFLSTELGPRPTVIVTLDHRPREIGDPVVAGVLQSLEFFRASTGERVDFSAVHKNPGTFLDKEWVGPTQVVLTPNEALEDDWYWVRLSEPPETTRVREVAEGITGTLFYTGGLFFLDYVEVFFSEGGLVKVSVGFSEPVPEAFLSISESCEMVQQTSSLFLMGCDDFSNEFVLSMGEGQVLDDGAAPLSLSGRALKDLSGEGFRELKLDVGDMEEVRVGHYRWRPELPIKVRQTIESQEDPNK